MRDSTIRRLVKKIFPQLWLKHKLISRIPSTCINSPSEIAVLSKIISETVLVYLHTYRPTLNEYLNRNIPTMPRSRQKFWYHISFLCSQVCLVNDNIFDYFLTTCSITAEVALFCHAMNFDNVLPYASIFFTAFFEKELSHRFYSSGGWQGLKTYIENSCYNELYGIVNGYVKKINHPTELLPILITLKNEHFAAERRERLLSLQTMKTRETEENASLLVNAVLHWDFKEGQRLSERKPVLKRGAYTKFKRNKFDDSLSVECVNKTSTKSNGNLFNVNDDEFIDRTIPYSAMEPAPESISDANFFDSKQTIQIAQCIQIETGLNLEHLKSMKREETNLHKIQNDTKNKVNREFNPNSDDLPYYIYYINPSFLHLTSQENMNQPEDCNTIQSIINIMAIEQVENSTNPMVASNQSTFRATVEQTFNDDKLCEFMESLEELGMVCLNMRNLSNQNPKFKLIPNFEEIYKRCRHFLSKQSSDIQCIMLIPRSSSVNSFFISPDSEKQEEKDTPNEDKLKSKQHFTEIEDSENFKKEYGIVKTPRLLKETENGDLKQLITEDYLLEKNCANLEDFYNDEGTIEIQNNVCVKYKKKVSFQNTPSVACYQLDSYQGCSQNSVKSLKTVHEESSSDTPFNLKFCNEFVR